MKSNAFVQTDTVLDKILAHKQAELDLAQRQTPLASLKDAVLDAPAPRDFVGALRRETVALIAEVKKASPSKGLLTEDFDAVSIGRLYAENGAAAISVLTDERFFQGHLAYMRQVREAVSVPVLRKDFTIDAYQVYEGRAAGADAMLLIVAALTDAQLAELHSLIVFLGMTALVEVHHEAELERALKLSPALIGVNNRDLKSFHVDTQTTARLAKQVPSDVILVAESGLANGADVYAAGQMGAQAVLVGEALIKAADRAAAVREFSGQPRETPLADSQ